MNKEGKFLVYCLEIYRSAKNMTGKQVMELFKRYGVTDYVMKPCIRQVRMYYCATHYQYKGLI